MRGRCNLRAPPRLRPHHLSSSTSPSPPRPRPHHSREGYARAIAEVGAPRSPPARRAARRCRECCRWPPGAFGGSAGCGVAAGTPRAAGCAAGRRAWWPRARDLLQRPGRDPRPRRWRSHYDSRLRGNFAEQRALCPFDLGRARAQPTQGGNSLRRFEPAKSNAHREQRTGDTARSRHVKRVSSSSGQLIRASSAIRTFI
jgi:hypothetical protein